jgi:hypothetical protein
MRTLSAFALAMVLATGAALAQGTGGSGSGSSSGGGTPSGPGGTSTGKEAGAMPTTQDCARGWQAGSRWTQTEFNEACKKK